MAAADTHVEVVHERLAKLTVTRSPRPTLDLLSDAVYPLHWLGFRSAPLYEIDEGYSPDEDWRIRRLDDGAYADRVPTPAPDEAYMQWVAGSRAVRGHGVLGHLPPGRYLLVRSIRPARRARRVQFGNCIVPATPNLRVLEEDEPCVASIVGANASLPPDLAQPLLGFVVLQINGHDDDNGVHFLQWSSFGTVDPGPERDLVLIIPVEGPFVFVNWSCYWADGGAALKAVWRDQGAAAFADWCVEGYRFPDEPLPPGAT